MTTKLNQIIAIEKGVKAGAFTLLTDAHHAAQRTGPLAGISRTYRPRDEDGEQLPPESTKVQVSTTDVLNQVRRALVRLFDVTATRDVTNCSALADVVVDGVTLLRSVPATHLLWLEKQLTDLRTFFAKLPTLDPAETWTFDANTGVFRSEPVETVRTKKVPRNHVLAEATDRHPAQVQMYTEDVPVGTWKTIKFSGALPATEVTALVERVEKLQRAVKFAREQANSTEVQDVREGDRIFDYLLHGVTTPQ